jgi:putative Mn2+ efflux pump MntP
LSDNYKNLADAIILEYLNSTEFIEFLYQYDDEKVTLAAAAALPRKNFNEARAKTYQDTVISEQVRDLIDIIGDTTLIQDFLEEQKLHLDDAPTYHRNLTTNIGSIVNVGLGSTLAYLGLAAAVAVSTPVLTGAALFTGAAIGAYFGNKDFRNNIDNFTGYTLEGLGKGLGKFALAIPGMIYDGFGQSFNWMNFKNNERILKKANEGHDLRGFGITVTMPDFDYKVEGERTPEENLTDNLYANKFLYETNKSLFGARFNHRWSNYGMDGLALGIDSHPLGMKVSFEEHDGERPTYSFERVNNPVQMVGVGNEFINMFGRMREYGSGALTALFGEFPVIEWFRRGRAQQGFEMGERNSKYVSRMTTRDFRPDLEKYVADRPVVEA